MLDSYRAFSRVYGLFLCDATFQISTWFFRAPSQNGTLIVAAAQLSKPDESEGYDPLTMIRITRSLMGLEE